MSAQETQVPGMKCDPVQARNVLCAEDHVQVQEAKRAEMTATNSTP